MSAPRLSACAKIVRQLDPDLFHAALFAPEPQRERLMVLYAFDIELSKAAARTAEPIIARMRLQWWRDLIAGIAAGEPARKHEVAEPLHGLLVGGDLPGEDLALLIGARELEIEGPLDVAGFSNWIDGRFGALTRLAVHLLADDDAAARKAANAAGRAMGTGFALRHAVDLAADNRFLLPGLAPEDRAALSRGRTTDATRALVRQLARDALGALSDARAEYRAVPRAAVPALLAVWRAERDLRRAFKPGFRLVSEPRGASGRGLSLIWRALTGRW